MKPIEKAFVTFNSLWGTEESAVYELSFYLDIECFHESERADALIKAKHQIINLYTFLLGDVTSYVKFDFELENNETTLSKTES